MPKDMNITINGEPTIQRFYTQEELDKAVQGENEACALMADSYNTYPDLAEAHNGLGVALARKGEITKALQSFEKAIEIKPDYTAAIKNIDSARAKSSLE